MPPGYGVGTQSPTCALVEYGTASGLVHPQPKPGPSVYCFVWARVEYRVEINSLLIVGGFELVLIS